MGTIPTYLVNVLAADGTSTTTHAVAVTVTNVNEKPAFPGTEDGQRSVNENTGCGYEPIGDPVEGHRPRSRRHDSPTFLTALMLNSSTFDESTVVRLKTKSDLDAEGRATYSYVDVHVHDGKDADGNISTTSDAYVNVTITVENVNEAPVVSGTTTTIYIENEQVDVATYSFDDPDTPDSDISWSPSGVDANAFTISEFGVLSFVSSPDFEAQEEYSVKVVASDGELTGTLDVTITISDVNEYPNITGRTPITFVETASGPVETFDAGDPEEGPIAWEVLGTDRDDFTIANGALNFASTPSYQAPADQNGDNVYDIIVKATDDATQSSTLPVTVIVTDENQKPEFPGATTTRDVSENMAPSQNVGSPVRASDPENDTLTYSLSGTESSHFDISTLTGQILTKGELDYDGSKNSYTVTVSVTDNTDVDGNSDLTVDDTIVVTINVIDENEGPEITSGATTTTWKENATGTVGTYIAQDPEGATTTWTVHGTDAAHFGISEEGELYIDTVPDYEGKNFYQVRVQASDGDNIADLAVTITITNVDEPGTVTLSPSQPEVGTHVNADVTDPDRIVSSISWSWHRSPSGSTPWTPIHGATGSGYTPVDTDEGNYLQASAHYEDGHGAGKSASSASDNPVPTTNSQPTFSPNIVRSVDENTGPDQPIGDPVTASNDETDDTLTYELGGTDADSFRLLRINWAAYDQRSPRLRGRAHLLRDCISQRWQGCKRQSRHFNGCHNPSGPSL